MKNCINSKRWVVLIVLGAVLSVAGVMEAVDEFWSGMGGGLIGIGIVQMIRYIRFNKDVEYKERYEVAVSDERNKFIAMKAWSWAGYIFVLTSALGTIVFKLLGREDIMIFCSTSVCFIMIAYWVCHLILKRKY